MVSLGYKSQIVVCELSYKVGVWWNSGNWEQANAILIQLTVSYYIWKWFSWYLICCIIAIHGADMNPLIRAVGKGNFCGLMPTSSALTAWIAQQMHLVLFCHKFYTCSPLCFWRYSFVNKQCHLVEVLTPRIITGTNI